MEITVKLLFSAMSLSSQALEITIMNFEKLD